MLFLVWLILIFLITIWLFFIIFICLCFLIFLSIIHQLQNNQQLIQCSHGVFIHLRFLMMSLLYKEFMYSLVMVPDRGCILYYRSYCRCVVDALLTSMAQSDLLISLSRVSISCGLKLFRLDYIIISFLFFCEIEKNL